MPEPGCAGGRAVRGCSGTAGPGLGWRNAASPTRWGDQSRRVVPAYGHLCVNTMHVW